MVISFDIETLGLDASQHQVILIGIKRKGRIKQWKLWEIKDESKMILRCIKVLEKIPFSEVIVGYNNLKFDVPFMTQRLHVLGKMSSKVWEILYKERKWFDLYQFLGNDFRSLIFWLDKLGIRRKYEELTGELMPKFYERRGYEKIEQHNRDDLNTSMKLYLKLQKEHYPELLPP